MTAEVLRGMHVEAVPLRLVRPRPAASDPPAPSPNAAAETAHQELMRARLEQAAQQGREEGLRAGYEDGRQRGEADGAVHASEALQQAIAQAVLPLGQQQERLRSLGASLEAAMREALAAAEDEMVALCFETLCRVLGATAVQPDTVRLHLCHAAAQVRPGTRAVLHVHPDDAALLAAADDPAAPAFVQGLACVADPQVALGGCIVRSAAGNLDARLETMLDGCKAALLEARAQRRAKRPQRAAGAPT